MCSKEKFAIEQWHEFTNANYTLYNNVCITNYHYEHSFYSFHIK